MIRNYIKTTLRNLIRNKLYSIINIGGLAIGLAVCMIIMLYVAHERSYDEFHKNAKQIVALHGQLTINGNTMDKEFMSYHTGPMIKENIPAVEDYSSYFKYFLPVTVNTALSPQSKFNENNLLFADAGFFSFFSFKLLSGQPTDVLSKPFTVVISKDMAKKYFAGQDPVGKTLIVKTDSAYTYLVTGVAENNPSNSSINYNFVASATSLGGIKGPMPFLEGPRIGLGFFNVYLLLKH
ncbi:MAG TPA: ABC transporter permease, partial [Mucilaginibacter sp.]|nr:ABC transporter permease [Mucilaginibacter sp.]